MHIFYFRAGFLVNYLAGETGQGTDHSVRTRAEPTESESDHVSLSANI